MTFRPRWGDTENPEVWTQRLGVSFLPRAAFPRAELKVEQGRKGMSNPPRFLLSLSPVYTGASGALSTVLSPWYPVPCTEEAPT